MFAISRLGSATLFGLLVFGTDAAVAEMSAPPVGAQYDYLCSQNGESGRRIEWTIRSSKGGVLLIGETIDGVELWRETPVYLFGSTIASRRMAIDGERLMKFKTGGFFSSGDFGALEDLEVGTTAEADVVEWVTDKVAFGWNYSFSIEKRGVVDHEVLGKTVVVVILEHRSMPNYQSWRKIFYSPLIAGPVAFNYVDDLGLDERCMLTAYHEAGAAN